MRHLLLVFCCFLSLSSLAQKPAKPAVKTQQKQPAKPADKVAPPKIDTIALAQKTAYAKDFAKADALLAAYNGTHKDINGYRLQAQVLGWMNNNEKAAQVYEKALQLFPNQSLVKLDYGRLLFQQYSFAKAKAMLNGYLKSDAKNAEANLLLIYIDNLEGRTNQAKQRANDFLKWYPDNGDAKGILQDIIYKTALVATVGGDYINDLQPITGYSYDLGLSRYVSWLFHPELAVKMNQYKITGSSHHTVFAELSNSLSLYKAGLNFSFGGGIFSSGIKSANPVFIGYADISKKLSNQLSLQLGVAKKPYQYTIAGIQQGTTFQTTTAALSYNKGDKWLGKAGYQSQHFTDGNNIASLYGWLLAPVFSKKIITVQAGYSFSYGNADKNTYRSVKTADELIAANAYSGYIDGVYDPYFSPKNQVVHSALGVVNIKTKKVGFTAKANVGFSAKLDVPYLYTDTDSTNKVVFGKSYLSQTYSPLEVSAEAAFKLSHKVTLVAAYTYSHLYFYTNNNFSLHLKYTFFK